MSQTFSTQNVGLMSLNPNAFSGNAMTLSPIMPNAPPLMGASSCGSFPDCGEGSQQGYPNTMGASATGNSACDSVNTSTVSTKSSSDSTTATKSTTRRKYTHNPYASSRNNSSANSCASSENSSTPPTPHAASFNPHEYTSQIQAMAAAGATTGSAHHSNLPMQQQQQQQGSGVYYGGQQLTGSPMDMQHFMLPASASSSTTPSPLVLGPNNGIHVNNNANNNNNNNNNGHHLHRSNSNNMFLAGSGSFGSNSGLMAADGSNGLVMMYGGSVHSLKNATEQFDSIRGCIAQSSCSQRGRHIVIAMIRLQQPEYTDAIFAELAPAWGQLLTDMNGCHVARTFVECLPSNRMADLTATLSRDVVLSMCAASQHSRRVLQAMFENHRADILQSVVEHIVSGCVALATTQQGCISVMRVLEFSTPTQRAQLMAVLSPHLAALAMDPYGNYVVQTITQSFSNEDTCNTFEKSFEGSWVPLSCNKFASNVVEKLIRISTPSLRSTILEELCMVQQNLGVIISDGFGNFVLQAIIDSCSNAQEFRRVSDRVRPLLASSPYGHKIEGKLKAKRFNNTTKEGSSASSAASSTSSTPVLAPTPI